MMLSELSWLVEIELNIFMEEIHILTLRSKTSTSFLMTERATYISEMTYDGESPYETFRSQVVYPQVLAELNKEVESGMDNKDLLFT